MENALKSVFVLFPYLYSISTKAEFEVLMCLQFFFPDLPCLYMDFYILKNS